LDAGFCGQGPHDRQHVLRLAKNLQQECFGTISAPNARQKNNKQQKTRKTKND
jgi:hypothetical protein